MDTSLTVNISIREEKDKSKEGSVTIDTTQFGEIKVREAEVITFVQSIIGFNGQRRFVIVEDKKFFPIQWLQSVDEPELAFPIINPSFLNIEYSLGGDDMAALDDIRLDNLNDAVIYTFMVIPSDCIEETRTNLKAPVIINTVEMLAKQVICEDPRYPVRYYILKEKNRDAIKGDRSKAQEKVCHSRASINPVTVPAKAGSC